MEKIIINPQDYNAIEVSLNGQFAPYMGMNQWSYRELLKKEEYTLQELKRISLRADLTAGGSEVLQKVIELMRSGFHVALILDMLKITIGKRSEFGDDFHHRFEPLFKEEDCRKDFWGTKESIPFLATIKMLDSLMS